MREKQVCFHALLIAMLLIQISCAFEEQEFDGDATVMDFSNQGLLRMLDLSTFSSLEEVSFARNDLETIEWMYLSNAPHLLKVDLSDNTMLALPDNGPGNSVPLQVLNMSNCRVMQVPRNALDGLVHLKVLDLRENQISWEDSPVFDELKTPPELLIVSTMKEPELNYVCHHVDMQVRILDESKTVACKDVRRRAMAVSQSQKREKLGANGDLQDVIILHNLLGPTHLDTMLGDQAAIEGSGSTETDDNDSKMTMEEDNTIGTANETIPKNETENSVESDQDDKAYIFGTANVIIQKNETENSAETIPDEIPDIASSETNDTVANDNSNSTQTVDGDRKQETNTSVPVIDGENTKTIDKPTVRKINVEVGVSETDAMALPPVVNDHSEHISHGVDETEKRNKLERMRIGEEHRQSEDTNNLQEDNTDSASTSNKNIILGLLVGALIMGAVLVGIKLYKDRKTYDYVAGDETDRKDDKDGKGIEMMDLPFETKPLMEATSDYTYDDILKYISVKLPASDATTASKQPKQFAVALVNEQQEEEEEKEEQKTTIQILEDAANSGLPDIDDPSRLSTIIISTSNLNITMGDK